MGPGRGIDGQTTDSPSDMCPNRKTIAYDPLTMNYLAILGSCFVLIAIYQLATGSLSLHVGKAPKPAIRPSPRGTRLFAAGLACFGTLMAAIGWAPTALQGIAAWVVVIGLLVASWAFWWSAIRIWKRQARAQSITGPVSPTNAQDGE